MVGGQCSLSMILCFNVPKLPTPFPSERFRCPREVSTDTEVLLISLQDSNGDFLMKDYTVLWTEPMNLVAEAAAVVIDVAFVAPCDDGSVSVTLVSDLLALHVVLTTTLEGNFNENSFVLRKDEPKMVYFFPPLNADSPIDPIKLQKTVRVEHLLSYV